MDGSNKSRSQDVENARISKHLEYHEDSTTKNVDNQDHYKHNLVCFWMIGLCNGIGYTVLSSATFDIIRRLDGFSV